MSLIAPKLSRRRRELTPEGHGFEAVRVEPETRTRYRVRMEHALGVPFVDGNAINILRNGDEIFPAMLEAIRAARTSVEFETYIFWTGKVAEEFCKAFCERARAGVAVRVLLDSAGCLQMDRALEERMKDVGVEVRWFRPLSTWRFWRTDKRTHRKILVVDDRIAFTGGVGIADEWLGDARNPNEWRETHMSLVGPAVQQFSSTFYQNWNEAGDWTWPERVPEPVPPQPQGVPVQVLRASATVGWTDMATLLHSLVSVARSSIMFTTAYFVPDPRFVRLLVEAAERGVDVRLLVPGKHCDSRLSQLAGHVDIEPLLRAGVKMWQFEGSLLHAKVAVIDGLLSCVGSTNINHRSLSKDEECCAIMLSPQIGATLEKQFQEDIANNGEAFSLERWQKRSVWLRIGERLSRLLVEQL